MNTIKYFGCFFSPEELGDALAGFERKPLYRTITSPHITIIYRPDEIPEELIGAEICVSVIGYGNDGENEALLVEFKDLPAKLRTLTENIPVPHITLSVSRDGHSVNSRNLTFRPIPPFSLVGKVGIMGEDGIRRT